MKLLTQRFKRSKNSKLLLQLSLIVCMFFTAQTSYANEENPSSTQQTSATSSEIAKVNINTANAELISNSLKGIGLKKATAIVEYRKTYGPFQNIDELSSVSGIGEKTVQKNSDLIAVK